MEKHGKQRKRSWPCALKKKLSSSIKNLLSCNWQHQPREHVKEVLIEQYSHGHDYDEVYKDCFDLQLTSISIEEPYLKTPGQIINFYRFCEAAKENSPQLKDVEVITKNFDANELTLLKGRLKTIGLDLTSREDKALHDRAIQFNNGWFVKCGIGLHYFKDNSADFAQRKCRKTSLDFYRCPPHPQPPPPPPPKQKIITPRCAQSVKIPKPHI